MKFERDFSIAYASTRSGWWKFVETVLLSVLLFFLARWFNPGDPFSLRGPIPWLIFVPVFCSLFFGLLYGILSLLIYFAMLLRHEALHLMNLVLREYLAGSLGLTLLAGLFSSYWTTRIRQVEHLNDYVREHLESLSRDYYLLRISHERIEQSYIIKPLSFRDAFIQIEQQIAKRGKLDAASAEALLHIFSQFCSINDAALCLYEGTNKESYPLAYLGKPFPINLDDALVKPSLQGKHSSYIAVNHLGQSHQSDYLAVIPLIDTQQQLKGLIVIKAMPFWTLTHDNLEVLSVFAAYFIMKLEIIQSAEPLIKEFPSCPPEFLKEFRSLVYLKKVHNVNSSLACVLVPASSQQNNIVYNLEQQKRALDYIWTQSLKGAKLFITLMPLTGLEGMLGYKQRIAALLKSDFGLVLNQEGLNFRFQQLNGQSSVEQLHAFIEEATHALA
jgi:polysaccharide biosynthesis protein PelD